MWWLGLLNVWHGASHLISTQLLYCPQPNVGWVEGNRLHKNSQPPTWIVSVYLCLVSFSGDFYIEDITLGYI